LSLAASGLPRHPLVGHCLPHILEEVRAEEATFISESLVASTNKKFRFQKAVASRLLAVLYPDDTGKTIRKRVRKYFPEEVHRLSDEILCQLQEFSRSLPTALSQQLLRTWANGWCTSARFRESHVLPCLFGCSDQPDSLQHYLFCSPLWSAIASFDNLPIEADILSVLAITKRDFGIALRLIVASHVYHRARSDHLDRFLLFARGQDLDASFDLLKVPTHTAFTL